MAQDIQICCSPEGVRFGTCSWRQRSRQWGSRGGWLCGRQAWTPRRQSWSGDLSHWRLSASHSLLLRCALSLLAHLSSLYHPVDCPAWYEKWIATERCFKQIQEGLPNAVSVSTVKLSTVNLVASKTCGYWGLRLAEILGRSAMNSGRCLIMLGHIQSSDCWWQSTPESLKGGIADLPPVAGSLIDNSGPP